MQFSKHLFGPNISVTKYWWLICLTKCCIDYTYIQVGIQSSHTAVTILEVVDKKHKSVFVQGYIAIFLCFAELLCVGKTPWFCGLPWVWQSGWSEWAEGKSPEPVHHPDLLLQKGRSRCTKRDRVPAFSPACLHTVPQPPKLDQAQASHCAIFCLPLYKS